MDVSQALSRKLLANSIAETYAGAAWPDVPDFVRIWPRRMHTSTDIDVALLLLDARRDGALAILATILNAAAIEDLLGRPEYYVALVVAPNGDVLAIRYFSDESELADTQAIAFDLNTLGQAVILVGLELEPETAARVAAAGLNRCEPWGSA